MPLCLNLEGARTMPRKLSVVPDGSKFGAWLREARTSRGLTMEALAEYADTASPVISNLERGVRNPSRDMVVRLARGLADDDMSEASIVRLVNQGLVAAGFQPMGDTEPDPAHDDLLEAGYSELSEEARRTIVTLIKQMRKK